MGEYMNSSYIRIFEVRNEDQQSFRVPLPNVRRGLDEHIFGAVRSNTYNFRRCDCRNGQTCHLCVPESIQHITIDLASAIEEALSAVEPTPPSIENNVSVIPKYKAAHVLEDECAICFEKIKKNQYFRALPCSETASHIYHAACIDSWLSKNDTCPVCRAKVL